MYNSGRSAPMLAMDAPTSLKHIVLCLERVVYVLQRVAGEPSALLDGRFHDTLRAAVDTLDGRIRSFGGWNRLLDAQDDPQVKARLEAHGLLGPEWMFKHQAFDHRFQEFLDRIAILERNATHMNARLTDLEIEDFKVKVRSTKQGTQSLLDCGSPILESAASALPFGEGLIGSVKEMGGVLRGLISQNQS